jgi:streptothricin acetyltransferase
LNLRIEEISRANQRDLNRIDETFIVDCVLDIAATGFSDTLHFIPVTPYEKHYPPEIIEVSKYINSDNGVVFFAYVDGILAGQIIIKRNWNQHALIEDIAVDKSFQRMSVGKTLMHRSFEWAKQHGFPALMLETQNINAPACRFYHACGFKIGGWDRFLYYGLPESSEVALFWYFFL